MEHVFTGDPYEAQFSLHPKKRSPGGRPLGERFFCLLFPPLCYLLMGLYAAFFS